jgi:hypothetical protein
MTAVPPGRGGTAHQLIIVPTPDLRDVAVTSPATVTIATSRPCRTSMVSASPTASLPPGPAMVRPGMTGVTAARFAAPA